MSTDISINEFYSSFCEEISVAQDVETHGWEPQDFFTAASISLLETEFKVSLSLYTLTKISISS